MKIGLQTWGTEGDVRPFLALAAGLKSAGHETTLLTTEIQNRDFSVEAEKFQITYRPVGHIACGEERFKQLVQQVFNEKNPARMGLILLENFFDPVAEDILAAAKRLCSENDVVIGHFLVWPLKIAALKSSRPHIAVHTTPIIPSAQFPPQGLPRLGRWWNSFWWRVLDLVLNRMWKPPVDAVYKKEGIRPAGSLIKDVWPSKRLNLISVSPSLFPPPPDWPDHYHLCGFCNLPQDKETEQVPNDLQHFLDTGEQPVYMTFGSMLANDPDPHHITQLMVDSARQAGVRAIIQSNWHELDGIAEHPSIYRTVRAPHRIVFPKCAAIVHHGGAGTTQAAIEAGRPSVVVAHASDQPFWGSVLARQGAAPKFLVRRSISVEKLAASIRIVKNSPQMKTVAEGIGRRMREENGVEKAIKLISEHSTRV